MFKQDKLTTLPQMLFIPKKMFTTVKIITISTLLITATACSITDVTSTTSGTVDSVTPDITLKHFVDVRLATIKKEAAVGYGENLDALAEMMGKRDKIAFGAWMQLNYDELFNGLDKPGDLITRIEKSLPTT